MTKVVLIAGSPAEPSRSTAVLDYVANYLQQHSIETSLIHVRELDATELLHADWNGKTITAAIQQVTQADAIVIATPIYKAAYTGILKAFLDLLPQRALESKIVLPIATGGSSSHMLAVDYALKPVLNAMGVQISLKTIYITDSQITYGNGAGIQFNDPDIENRLTAGLNQLLHLLNLPILSI